MQEFQVAIDSPNRKDVAFTPDGRFLAVGAKEFTLLDTAGGAARTFPGFDGTYWGTALVRGGSELVYAASHGRGLKVLEFATGTTREQNEPTVRATAVAATLHGDTFFVSEHHFGANSCVRQLAVADFAERGTFAEMTDWISRLAFSADGRWLAGTSIHALWVWRIGAELPKQPAMTAAFDGTSDFALSGDGAHLAAVNTRGLCVWDTRTRKEAFRSGKHRRSVTAVACHPSKPLIATGDNAGDVFLWDHRGRVLTRFDWGLGHASGLAFAPDGLRCAAVGGSGKVVVWDVDA